MSTHIPGASTRKDDHIRLAAAQQSEVKHSEYDDVELRHHALAGVSPEQVSLKTQVGPWDFVAPLFINGMTGGTDTALPINRALARAAAETGLPMASGSVGVALDYPDDPRAVESFKVIRQENPSGLVFANIGGGRGVDDAVRAVELLNADGLQIHLNTVQETVMPEGSRDFSSWLGHIEQICQRLAGYEIPVIVKEVGFGLSAKTLERLYEAGVCIADVSGSGGTHFGRIENSRRDLSSSKQRDYSFLNDWGSSAVQCLLDAYQARIEGKHLPQILSSGGVRNPLDVVRSLALGARAVGVAGSFLTVAMEQGAEGLVSTINGWLKQVGELQGILGATSPQDLQYTDVLLHGAPAEFAAARGIDVRALMMRKEL